MKDLKDKIYPASFVLAPAGGIASSLLVPREEALVDLKKEARKIYADVVKKRDLLNHDLISLTARKQFSDSLEAAANLIKQKKYDQARKALLKAQEMATKALMVTRTPQLELYRFSKELPRVVEAPSWTLEASVQKLTDAAKRFRVDEKVIKQTDKELNRTVVLWNKLSNLLDALAPKTTGKINPNKILTPMGIAAGIGTVPVSLALKKEDYPSAILLTGSGSAAALAGILARKALSSRKALKLEKQLGTHVMRDINKRLITRYGLGAGALGLLSTLLAGGAGYRLLSSKKKRG